MSSFWYILAKQIPSWQKIHHHLRRPEELKPNPLEAPQAVHKRSPKQIKQLNRLVESYKLLMAITALCDGADSKVLNTLLVEAQALCAHTITSNRLSQNDQDIAANTARDQVAAHGYKFRDGTSLKSTAFKRWTQPSSVKIAVLRQEIFRDYEKDAMHQLHRLEKREYLQRVAKGIIRDKQLLEKAHAQAAKAARAKA